MQKKRQGAKVPNIYLLDESNNIVVFYLRSPQTFLEDANVAYFMDTLHDHLGDGVIVVFVMCSSRKRGTYKTIIIFTSITTRVGDGYTHTRQIL